MIYFGSPLARLIYVKQEPVKYTKKILKNGDKCTFPKKGDEVECFYTGKLDNGKVFDTNMEESLCTFDSFFL